VNPNADFIFIDPDGKKSRISRVIDRPSALSRPIKPHPTGLEIGEITGMIRENENYSLKDFLIKSLSRVSERTVEEICAFTSISPDRIVSTLSIDDLKKLIESFRSIKFPPPPTDCLAPLGVEFIRRGLKNIYGDQQPLYYGKPIQRPVSVYNGNPFSVEVGIVFGGNLPADEQVRVVRFANKVPLLYQQGACAITKAVSEMDWRGYGLDQRGGKGVPFGPAIIMVHVFGISLPFTSESKEAIAGIEQISEEVTSALKSAARGVRAFINKKEKRAKIMERFVLVEKIIPEIGEKCSMILGEKVPDMSPVLSKIANVVFVTEDVQKQQDSFRITVTVANFTTKEM
jgi:DNA topoisomerase-6 subunit B